MRFAFRLSLILRRPVCEVLDMPWWAFSGYAEYLSKSPPPEDRAEHYLARLIQLQRAQMAGANAAPIELDACYMFPRNPWATEEDEAQAVANSIFKVLQRQS